MIAIISLLVALTLSLLVTRIAAVALTHTGLARQSARFQARSAFTGVGFTTSESEKVVHHPVRRRILMTLMLLGNAGIVTVFASMVLAFLDGGQGAGGWLWELVILALGIAVLWTAATSRWLDRRLESIIRRFLRRYTDLDVRDYHGLLHLGGEYQIGEHRVEPDGWLAGRTLAESKLGEEGLLVLGIQTPDGEYFGVPDGQTRLHAGYVLLAYGRESSFERLAARRKSAQADQDHAQAVAEQRSVRAEQKREERRREQSMRSDR